MKELSIIIPVFNVQKYLKDCIESIIISKKDFEILLIDDGSTDNSSIICDEYTKKDKRIKTYHKENGGVSSARNYGIKVATGDYIIFVDADDILSNDWDRIIDYIEDEDIYYYNSIIREPINKNILLRYITGTNSENIYLSGPMSKAFKHDFIIRNGLYYNEKLINGEDMIYNIEAAILANSFKIINFKYYFYRQNTEQTTRSFNKRIIDSDRIFHKSLNKIFEKYKIDNVLSNDIKDFCLSNAIILILNRITYLDSFHKAKEYFDFLNQEPYCKVIIDKTNKYNKSFILKLCKFKKYRLIYHYLKYRNKIAILLKYKKKGQFIEI